MPLCHDPRIILPLLATDEPGTRSIYNLVLNRAGAPARWIRVDRLDDSRAVLVRSGAPWRGKRLYLYGTDNGAVRSLIQELPANWKLVFAGSPLRLARVVGRVRHLNRIHANYLYVLHPGQLKTDRSHRVGFLTAEDVATIAPLWANGRQRNYITWRIGAGPTAAIRVKGELAAWACTHADGSMAMLRVMEPHRGTGMGRTITYALARRVLEFGLKPFLHINRKNAASISLCESMGFTRHATYAWFSE